MGDKGIAAKGKMAHYILHKRAKWKPLKNSRRNGSLVRNERAPNLTKKKGRGNGEDPPQ